MSQYKEQLLKLDAGYFNTPEDDEIDNWELLCYHLATWLYDRGFSADEESWQELEQISEIFGSDIKNRVLYNMFHSEYDT